MDLTSLITGRIPGEAPNRAVLAAQAVLPELAPTLRTKGLHAGDPIFIRIFKAERELELWVFHREDRQFRLFKTYRIEGMSGNLGPKLAEGDRQAPEGFYFVNRGRMNPNSNYHLSFDLGYPNAYDRDQGWTGSYLMVHGSWVSAGCFAMTDYGIEEIYTLADAALSGDQRYFRVHIFPFRMTNTAMNKVREHKWFAFWENLREGYDYFERWRLPPDVKSLEKRYAFADAAPFIIAGEALDASSSYEWMTQLSGDWKLASADQQEGKATKHKLVAPMRHEHRTVPVQERPRAPYHP